MRNLRRFFNRLLLIVFTAFPVSTQLYGQFDAAAVLGTVRDEAGGVVPGVTVTLTDLGTGFSRTALTEDNGNYEFPLVKIGNYRISATLTGFSTAVADNIKVTVGARQRVDLTLRLGEITETVEVIGAAAIIQGESSDRGQVIQEKEVVGLPLNGRQYADLALLSPGVRASEKSREASFNVNGLRSTMNNFTLDGIDNNANGTSNQGFSNQVVQPSPDAVAEFKVQTNNFSAEYGRAGGAVINASLRSGTNDFHGNLWWFHRNDDITAKDFFTNRSGAKKPDFIRNQFGFTFGGPILKDDFFFFVDYEGFREKRGTTVFSTIPTLNQRAGILGVPVRNPLTGELFADGIIPADQISPFARKVFDGLPLPTEPGATNNFATASDSLTNTDKFDIRLDANVGSSLKLFGRVSHRKLNNPISPPIPGPSGGQGNGFIRVLNQQLALGLTWTLSPSALLEFRNGFNRTNAGKEPVNAGSPPAGELFGIPGLPTNTKITGGLPSQVISGFSRLGQQATNPQYQNPKQWNPRVNVSWLLGAHSLKVGYEFQRIRVGVQDVNPLNGEFRFFGQFSRPAGASGSAAAFNLADFIFGLPSQFSLVNFFEAGIQERMHFAYIQDDWKLRSDLTLNLGLRWEYGSPLFESDNQLSNFDPVTRSIILATGGSVENRALVNNDLNNFAPRIGLAWSLAPKTVLRAGYGVSFVHFIQQRVGGANLLPLNAPQVIIGRQVQTPSDPNFRTIRGDGNPRDGIPEGFNDPSTFDPLESTIRFVPKDSRTSYVQSWHLTIQREILPKTLLDVAYVGNLGLKLNVLGDLNEASPNPPGQIIPLQERRPIPGFSVISTAFNRAASNYHGLQVKLERRGDSLFLLNSFTWSKAIDNATGSLEDPNGNSGNPQSINNLNGDRGLSAFDVTVQNTTSLVWNIPFGKGQRWGSDLGSWVDGVLGGWQTTAIWNLRSGNVANLRYTPSSAFQVTANIPSHEGGTSFRPNVIGDPVDPRMTVDNYLSRETVVAPTDPSQPFGNAGRNTIRGEGFYSLDLGIFKDIRLPAVGAREDMKLQFRFEAFNVLNTTNLRAPNANLSSGGFGTIRSTFPSREIQFGLKLLF